MIDTEDRHFEVLATGVEENDGLDDAFDAAGAAMHDDGMPETTAPAFAHDSLALALGEQWEGDALYVPLFGKWLFWAGTRWLIDDRLQHMTKGRAFIRAKVECCKEMPAKARAEALKGSTINAVITLARSNNGMTAIPADFDRDPYLMGTPEGTVDLRTGRLRPANPADRITKSTIVAPAPAGVEAPVFTAFLERIFRHDPSLTPFLRRALGYSLIGKAIEHVLFFAWGMGGNGKGVLFNTCSRLLGDYAAIAPPDLLLEVRGDRIPTDVAGLRAARLVTASELAPGKSWDEPKLKGLTGGDPITARFMRQDFFTFEPQFTLFVAGNTKPSFRGVDEAIRRRVLLLPFLQNIPAEERDPNLPEKLKAEWPAILRWMVDGCLEWQRLGLQPPDSVRVATEEYLGAEDMLGQWLAECCVVSSSIGWTSLKSLFIDWKRWCEDRGQHAGTANSLGKKLDERGLERKREACGMGFLCVGVLEPAAGAYVDNADFDGKDIIDRTRARTRPQADGHNSENRQNQHSQHSDWEVDL